MRINKYILIFLLIIQSSCKFSKNEFDLNRFKLSNFKNLSGANILSISVNGSQCKYNYLNKPCVSVQICDPGDSNHCQVVDDILLDTGSVGLRIFRDVLEDEMYQSLTSIGSSMGVVTECIEFVDGSLLWGPIKQAGIILAGEPSVLAPVQIMDANFFHFGDFCVGAKKSSEDAGFKGILGIGPFEQDCGVRCVYQSNNKNYYTCNQDGCLATALALSYQVQNPAFLLPYDNNGIGIALPSVPTRGVKSIEGYLILGIDTQENNKPENLITYQANYYTGELKMTFNQKLYSAYLDTGSNAFFFPQPSIEELPLCLYEELAKNNFYCPKRYQILKARLESDSLPAIGSFIFFQIGNYNSLLNSSNQVFSNVGGSLESTKAFYMGLPFFMGHVTYLGFQNKQSSLGLGPYWAY